MSKFTPGPWKVVRYTTRGEFVTNTKIVSEDDSHLAEVGPVNIKVNAKLMSKAPEMYHLIVNLKELLITVYDDNSDLAKLIDGYIVEAQNLLKEIDGD